MPAAIAASTAWFSSAVLPIPGSPTITSALPASAARSRNDEISSDSSARPSRPTRVLQDEPSRVLNTPAARNGSSH